MMQQLQVIKTVNLMFLLHYILPLTLILTKAVKIIMNSFLMKVTFLPSSNFGQKIKQNKIFHKTQLKNCFYINCNKAHHFIIKFVLKLS